MDEQDREAAIEELRTALGELESENGLERLVEGHGLQSRQFVFRWSEPGLGIEFRLPYARVLSEEDDQRLDAARIGAACRMAVLLLAMMGEGGLLADGEEGLSVHADEAGEGYEVYGADGVEMDSGEDWDPLVARLKAAVPETPSGIQIIWP